MGKGGKCMLNFLKKLFGKNETQEPERLEPLKEELVETPKPKEEAKPSSVAAMNDARADFSNEKNVVSTKDKDVTVKEFKSPIKEEPKDDEPVYDIKTHSKGWQVILPGAQRATRVLDTKKEAIEYCKENDYKYKII